MTSIIVCEVDLYNVLDCKDVQITFYNHANPIYILCTNTTSPINSSLSMGLELLLCKKYETMKSIEEFTNIDNGYVRALLLVAKKYKLSSGAEVEIDFEEHGNLPQSSTEALEKLLRHRKMLENRKLISVSSIGNEYVYVDACRNFAIAPGLIQYSVNKGPTHIIPIADFHSIFCACLDYVYPRLQTYLENFSSVNPEYLRESCFLETSKPSALNPLEEFVKVFVNQNVETKELMSHLAKSCICVKYAIDVIARIELFNILRLVRRTFDYIACDDYTVWFFVPSLEDTVYDLEDNELTKEEISKLEMQYVTVFVQVKGIDIAKENSLLCYNDTEYYIKELLTVSFQIGVGFYCKRPIIFLRYMKATKENEYIQVSQALFYKGCNKSLNLDVFLKTYLSRIVDVCLDLKITVFIEYCGILPLLMKNVNLMKVYKRCGGDWGICVH